MSDAVPYPQIVLDHYRQPRHYSALPGCTHAADGINPLCGDALHVELRRSDGYIAEMRFSGEACAIATATASILGTLVRDLDGAKPAHLASAFGRLIASGDEDARLGPLNALGNLQRHPARRPCAQLAWAMLRAAFAGDAHASTQGERA